MRVWWLVLACRTPAPSGLADADGSPLRMGYAEATTAGADPDDALPLIVVVHGLGDVPESMLRVLADYPEPARIVAPRGLDPHHNGWSWFPIGVGGDDVKVAVPILSERAHKLADFVTAMSESRPTDGQPTITGFSQGGMLSFAVAVGHPEVVGRAVAVAGWLPPDLVPEGPAPPDAPPIHALHGEADTVLPLEPTRASVAVLQERGWTVDLQTFPDIQHGVPEPVRRAWYAALAADDPTVTPETAPPPPLP